MGNTKKKQFNELIQEILKFSEQRDWAQFNDPKNLAEAIAIESGELLEHFLWKTPKESRKISREKREKLAAEIADILIFSLLFAHETGVDIEKAILDKIRHNESRYPVDKAKGSAKKYTELHNCPNSVISNLTHWPNCTRMPGNESPPKKAKVTKSSTDNHSQQLLTFQMSILKMQAWGKLILL